MSDAPDKPQRPGLVNPKAVPVEAPRDPEEELPDKFRGQSPAQIARAYEELEKRLGKQGQELGELRRLAMMRQEPEEKPDFYDDPERAVDRLIERKVLPLRQMELERRLQTEHPNWRETVEDPEFSEWIGSSKVRSTLFQAARSQLDYEAADELLTTWEERKGADQEKAQRAVAKDRKRRAATSEAGSATPPRGKIYSQSWVQHIARTDPQRYKEILPDLKLAYQQGRVRS